MSFPPTNFCSNCGAKVVLRVPPGDSLPRHVCESCGTIHYRNPLMVVGTIPEWEDRILLCRRAIEPRHGFWTLPAGFMELGETTAQAALRETLEEAKARVELVEAGTSGDLARWARLLYSGEILGPETTALLFGGFSATARYRPSVAYGYGVQAAVIDGHASFGHSGRLLGFRGVVRHFPVDGLTIAVLTNQSRADPNVIVRDLLGIAIPTASACPICSTAN